MLNNEDLNMSKKATTLTKRARINKRVSTETFQNTDGLNIFGKFSQTSSQELLNNYLKSRNDLLNYISEFHLSSNIESTSCKNKFKS